MEITTTVSQSQTLEKKKRIDFLEGEKEILEVAYDGGMKNASKNCQDAIKSVAERLSCSEDRVKMWIGNRNSKVKGPGGAKIPKTRYTRGPSAYNIIAKTVERGTLSGPEYLKKVATTWQATPDEERKTATEQAKKIKLDPHLNMTKDEAVFHHLKLISKSCIHLEQLGMECGGVCVGQDKVPSIFGTKSCIKYFQPIVENIAEALIGSHFKTEQKPQRLTLKEDVRKLFNLCYARMGGKGQVPYKAIAAGKIDIGTEGLPDDINLKDPGSYSVGVLQKILQNEKDLVFRKLETPVIVTLPVDTPRDEETELQMETEETELQMETEETELQIETESIQELTPNQIIEEISETNGTHQIELAPNDKETDSPPDIPLDLLEATLMAFETDTKVEDEIVAVKSENIQTYAVEAIIDKRKKGSKVQYLIKWEGYSENDNSWEPSRNIPQKLRKLFNKK